MPITVRYRFRVRFIIAPEALAAQSCFPNGDGCGVPFIFPYSQICDHSLSDVKTERVTCFFGQRIFVAGWMLLIQRLCDQAFIFLILQPLGEAVRRYLLGGSREIPGAAVP